MKEADHQGSKKGTVRSNGTLEMRAIFLKEIDKKKIALKPCRKNAKPVRLAAYTYEDTQKLPQAKVLRELFKI